jgi:alpha-L-arabinofuranosidase
MFGAEPILAPQPMLTVDAKHVLRSGAGRVVGINLNYLRDADINRPQARPLKAALADLGVRWLRYPGGEKSDFYLWSQPPYTKPTPSALGWYKTVQGVPLDFDQYVSCARAVRAEPYVVVGYDTEQRTGRTKEQWIENAVSWVNYANRVRKYKIKYWEIGNENWHNGTSKPADMARIVVEFSRAMKAVDPTIRIGASGNNSDWWSQFLPLAAPALDFITLSLYNTWNWKSYDYFVQHPDVDLIAAVRSTLSAIDKHVPVANRKPLQVIVTETNSKDYSDKGWPGDNTLGHAIVTFETLGRLMQQKRVTSAMVWTTRWVDDAEAPRSQWYALGAKNELLSTGQALALWRGVDDRMVAVSGGSGGISAYASCAADQKSMKVWIVNRGYDRVKNISLSLRSSIAYRKAVVRQLSGTGPNDTQPHWRKLGDLAVAKNTLSQISCPGVSVTVISLR